MKKIVNVICYAVIAVLGIICLLGIFAVPDDNLPLPDFVYILVSSKVIGIGAGGSWRVWLSAGKQREQYLKLRNCITSFRLWPKIL